MHSGEADTADAGRSKMFSEWELFPELNFEAALP
jgi:hypothetical protein